jgi:glycosyltransferase involved in cell wall biosynthesis
MTEGALVSVIMPVHNRFLLVDEAVSSVFNQTHRPIQLIIVDDCSNEPFLPKVTSQPGFEVILIRHETNQGPGASRETGRQAATGGFIAYLDSDDLWHPQKLKKQVAMLQAHPETGMCYCTSVEFTQLPITGNEKIRNRSDQEYQVFLPTILSGRPWDTSACLWTRNASEQIGPWSDGWTWEDYEYEFRAGCRGIFIKHQSVKLCYYRVNHGENRLSETDKRTQVINRASSVIEMIKSNDKCGVNVSEKMRNQLLNILYYQAMHLFFLKEKQRGLEIIKVIRKTLNKKIALFSIMICLISPFFTSKQLGSLLYKFRFRLL